MLLAQWKQCSHRVCQDADLVRASNLSSVGAWKRTTVWLRDAQVKPHVFVNLEQATPMGGCGQQSESSVQASAIFLH